MANQYFRFKQFTIIQEKSAMKVGTDGVLLGAWANCDSAKNILDIGTGTGLIALMIAQRAKNAQINAVEIDKSAYAEAEFNIQNSPWKNSVSAFNTSFQIFSESSNQKYDLIVSNPPFFTKSKKADNDSRTSARHDDTLSVTDLFTGVNTLLTENGEFSVIIPSDSHDKFIKEAENVNMFCIKKLWIKPTPNLSPKRVLLAFSRIKNKCNKSTMIVELNGRHKYSDDYIKLTKDFYLSF